MLLNTSELFGTPSYLVMDPVHGGIPFFTHEKKIMDHILFQRLRHIKQNDILHYVFPGATHSRLEHSLGTMNVASEIFKSMIRNYLTNRREAEMTDSQINAIQYFYGCLRIASLLHDVGHMPFSHQFEESDAGKTLLADKDIIKKIWLDHFKDTAVEPEILSHENYSVRCASEILQGMDLPFEYQDILSMLDGSFVKPSATFVDSAIITIKLFSRVPEVVDKYPPEQIGTSIMQLFRDIISGEIDADKMDYLLRDSYFSGCNYGVYNLDHLTQNFCTGFDLEEPWVGIAINRKGLGALEDFIHSRFRMYLQVYNHKTVVGFKWLLRQAVTELLSLGDHLAYINAALSDIAMLSHFTDTYLWEAFRKHAISEPNSACGYLINRRKLKHLYALKDKADFEKRQKKEELKAKVNKDVIQHESSAAFSKISPSFSRLRLLVKDKIEDRFRLASISSESTFFSKFQDTIETHYYEAPDFLGSGSVWNAKQI